MTVDADLKLNRRFCVAPMMECTDRHDRFLLRLITRNAMLYTEMIPAGAVVHGDRGRVLRFEQAERPVALQVGGSDPAQMAQCARYAEAYGYDEININAGCPSSRVQSGRFGACLMAEPEVVAECVAAMRSCAAIPVTVKTRIGIDRGDGEAQLDRFVDTVSAAGCGVFIIHARKAWLQGLNPKQNRSVPPLDYDRVYRLKRSFPHLDVILNGGVAALDAAERHLARVDGVMMGREAYANPYLLSDVDRRLYGDPAPPPERQQILERYLTYCERQIGDDCRLHHLSRHLTGLFQGLPGARRWRRYLGENAQRPGAGVDVIRRAASAGGFV